MDITVRFTGRDGRTKVETLNGVGLPRAKDVPRRKGETTRQAFDRKVMDTARKAVFGVTSAELGQLSGEVAKRLKRRMSKAAALKLLSKVKKTRGVTFTVKIYRED